MNLNSLKPAPGAKKPRLRVGRGMGSGHGKTCGRGHKGQKARAGGFHKIGFEGGQMPLQRHLPKRGFKSQLVDFRAEVRLSDLEKLGVDDIDLLTLKQAGLVSNLVKNVKVILSGEISRSINLTGLQVTKGARAAIESKGGKIA